MATLTSGDRPLNPPKAHPQRRRPALGRRGGTAMMVAIAVPSLLGVGGMVMEAGNWYVVRRQVQTAADMAAVAGAIVRNGRAGDTARTEAANAALGVTKANGLDDAHADVTVTVNAPPTTGSRANNVNAVEVQVSRTVRASLLDAVMPGNGYSRTVTARGIALRTQGSAFCLYAQNRAIISDSNSMKIRRCGLHANGDAPNAITLGKMNSLEADSVTTKGGCDDGNYSHCADLGNRLKTGMAGVDNPFSDLDATTAPNSPAQYTGKAGETWNGPNPADHKSTWTRDTFRPGVYRGAGNWASNTGANTLTTFRLSTNSTTLDAGTYYFHNANLVLEKNNSLTCNGCTFVFTGDSPSQVGTLSLLQNNSMTLRAPTTDSGADVPGMLFVRAGGTNGAAGKPGVSIIKNNSSEMSGGQYFGNSYTDWSDNNSADSQLCNPMVAGVLNIYSSNSAVFSTEGCQARRMRSPQAAPQTYLVE